jgi:hypothetical protein
MGRISWLAEKLSASQEGLCSMELIYVTTMLMLKSSNWSCSAKDGDARKRRIEEAKAQVVL